MEDKKTCSNTSQKVNALISRHMAGQRKRVTFCLKKYRRQQRLHRKFKLRRPKEKLSKIFQTQSMMAMMCTEIPGNTNNSQNEDSSAKVEGSTSMNGSSTSNVGDITSVKESSTSKVGDITSMKESSTSEVGDITSMNGSSTSKVGDITSMKESSTLLDVGSTSMDENSTSKDGSSTPMLGSSTSKDGSSTPMLGSSTSMLGSSTSTDSSNTLVGGSSTSMNVGSTPMNVGSTSMNGGSKSINGGSTSKDSDDKHSKIASFFDFFTKALKNEMENFLGASTVDIPITEHMPAPTGMQKQDKENMALSSGRQNNEILNGNFSFMSSSKHPGSKDAIEVSKETQHDIVNERVAKVTVDFNHSKADNMITSKEIESAEDTIETIAMANHSIGIGELSEKASKIDVTTPQLSDYYKNKNKKITIRKSQVRHKSNLTDRNPYVSSKKTTPNMMSFKQYILSSATPLVVGNDTDKEVGAEKAISMDNTKQSKQSDSLLNQDIRDNIKDKIHFSNDLPGFECNLFGTENKQPAAESNVSAPKEHFYLDTIPIILTDSKSSDSPLSPSFHSTDVKERQAPHVSDELFLKGSEERSSNYIRDNIKDKIHFSNDLPEDECNIFGTENKQPGLNSATAYLDTPISSKVKSVQSVPCSPPKLSNLVVNDSISDDYKNKNKKQIIKKSQMRRKSNLSNRNPYISPNTTTQNMMSFKQYILSSAKPLFVGNDTDKEVGADKVNSMNNTHQSKQSDSLVDQGDQHAPKEHFYLDSIPIILTDSKSSDSPLSPSFHSTDVKERQAPHVRDERFLKGSEERSSNYIRDNIKDKIHFSNDLPEDECNLFGTENKKTGLHSATAYLDTPISSKVKSVQSVPCSPPKLSNLVVNDSISDDYKNKNKKQIIKKSQMRRKSNLSNRNPYISPNTTTQNMMSFKQYILSSAKPLVVGNDTDKEVGADKVNSMNNTHQSKQSDSLVDQGDQHAPKEHFYLDSIPIILTDSKSSDSPLSPSFLPTDVKERQAPHVRDELFLKGSEERSSNYIRDNIKDKIHFSNDLPEDECNLFGTENKKTGLHSATAYLDTPMSSTVKSIQSVPCSAPKLSNLVVNDSISDDYKNKNKKQIIQKSQVRRKSNLNNRNPYISPNTTTQNMMSFKQYILSSATPLIVGNDTDKEEKADKVNSMNNTHQSKQSDSLVDQVDQDAAESNVSAPKEYFYLDSIPIILTDSKSSDSPLSPSFHSTDVKERQAPHVNDELFLKGSEERSSNYIRDNIKDKIHFSDDLPEDECNLFGAENKQPGLKSATAYLDTPISSRHKSKQSVPCSSPKLSNLVVNDSISDDYKNKNKKQIIQKSQMRRKSNLNNRNPYISPNKTTQNMMSFKQYIVSSAKPLVLGSETDKEAEADKVNSMNNTHQSKQSDSLVDQVDQHAAESNVSAPKEHFYLDTIPIILTDSKSSDSPLSPSFHSTDVKERQVSLIRDELFLKGGEERSSNYIRDNIKDKIHFSNDLHEDECNLFGTENKKTGLNSATAYLDTPIISKVTSIQSVPCSPPKLSNLVVNDSISDDYKNKNKKQIIQKSQMRRKSNLNNRNPYISPNTTTQNIMSFKQYILSSAKPLFVGNDTDKEEKADNVNSMNNTHQSKQSDSLVDQGDQHAPKEHFYLDSIPIILTDSKSSDSPLSPSFHSTDVKERQVPHVIDELFLKRSEERSSNYTRDNIKDKIHFSNDLPEDECNLFGAENKQSSLNSATISSKVKSVQSVPCSPPKLSNLVVNDSISDDYKNKNKKKIIQKSQMRRKSNLDSRNPYISPNTTTQNMMSFKQYILSSAKPLVVGNDSDKEVGADKVNSMNNTHQSKQSDSLVDQVDQHAAESNVSAPKEHFYLDTIPIILTDSKSSDSPLSPSFHSTDVKERQVSLISDELFLKGSEERSSNDIRDNIKDKIHFSNDLPGDERNLFGTENKQRGSNTDTTYSNGATGSKTECEQSVCSASQLSNQDVNDSISQIFNSLMSKYLDDRLQYGKPGLHIKPQKYRKLGSSKRQRLEISSTSSSKVKASTFLQSITIGKIKEFSKKINDAMSADHCASHGETKSVSYKTMSHLPRNGPDEVPYSADTVANHFKSVPNENRTDIFTFNRDLNGLSSCYMDRQKQDSMISDGMKNKICANAVAHTFNCLSTSNRTPKVVKPKQSMNPNYLKMLSTVFRAPSSTEDENLDDSSRVLSPSSYGVIETQLSVDDAPNSSAIPSDSDIPFQAFDKGLGALGLNALSSVYMDRSKQDSMISAARKNKDFTNAASHKFNYPSTSKTTPKALKPKQKVNSNYLKMLSTVSQAPSIKDDENLDDSYGVIETHSDISFQAFEKGQGALASNALSSVYMDRLKQNDIMPSTSNHRKARAALDNSNQLITKKGTPKDLKSKQIISSYLKYLSSMSHDPPIDKETIKNQQLDDSNAPLDGLEINDTLDSFPNSSDILFNMFDMGSGPDQNMSINLENRLIEKNQSFDDGLVISDKEIAEQRISNEFLTTRHGSQKTKIKPDKTDPKSPHVNLSESRNVSFLNTISSKAQLSPEIVSCDKNYQIDDWSFCFQDVECLDEKNTLTTERSDLEDSESCDNHLDEVGVDTSFSDNDTTGLLGGWYNHRPKHRGVKKSLIKNRYLSKTKSQKNDNASFVNHLQGMPNSNKSKTTGRSPEHSKFLKMIRTNFDQKIYGPTILEIHNNDDMRKVKVNVDDGLLNDSKHITKNRNSIFGKPKQEKKSKKKILSYREQKAKSVSKVKGRSFEKRSTWVPLSLRKQNIPISETSKETNERNASIHKGKEQHEGNHWGKSVYERNASIHKGKEQHEGNHWGKSVYKPPAKEGSSQQLSKDLVKKRLNEIPKLFNSLSVQIEKPKLPERPSISPGRETVACSVSESGQRKEATVTKTKARPLKEKPSVHKQTREVISEPKSISVEGILNYLVTWKKKNDGYSFPHLQRTDMHKNLLSDMHMATEQESERKNQSPSPSPSPNSPTVSGSGLSEKENRVLPPPVTAEQQRYITMTSSPSKPLETFQTFRVHTPLLLNERKTTTEAAATLTKATSIDLSAKIGSSLFAPYEDKLSTTKPQTSEEATDTLSHFETGEARVSGLRTFGYSPDKEYRRPRVISSSTSGYPLQTKSPNGNLPSTATRFRSMVELRTAYMHSTTESQEGVRKSISQSPNLGLSSNISSPNSDLQSIPDSPTKISSTSSSIQDFKSIYGLPGKIWQSLTESPNKDLEYSDISLSREERYVNTSPTKEKRSEGGNPSTSMPVAKPTLKGVSQRSTLSTITEEQAVSTLPTRKGVLSSAALFANQDTTPLFMAGYQSTATIPTKEQQPSSHLSVTYKESGDMSRLGNEQEVTSTQSFTPQRRTVSYEQEPDASGSKGYNDQSSLSQMKDDNHGTAFSQNEEAQSPYVSSSASNASSIQSPYSIRNRQSFLSMILNYQTDEKPVSKGSEVDSHQYLSSGDAVALGKQPNNDQFTQNKYSEELDYQSSFMQTRKVKELYELIQTPFSTITTKNQDDRHNFDPYRFTESQKNKTLPNYETIYDHLATGRSTFSEARGRSTINKATGRSTISEARGRSTINKATGMSTISDNMRWKNSEFENIGVTPTRVGSFQLPYSHPLRSQSVETVQAYDKFEHKKFLAQKNSEPALSALRRSKPFGGRSQKNKVRKRDPSSNQVSSYPWVKAFQIKSHNRINRCFQNVAFKNISSNHSRSSRKQLQIPPKIEEEEECPQNTTCNNKPVAELMVPMPSANSMRKVGRSLLPYWSLTDEALKLEDELMEKIESAATHGDLVYPEPLKPNSVLLNM